MPANNLTHFVLVDFENVPGVDLAALGGHPLCVALFLGPNSKLKPALVEQITTLPFEVRLIKVTTSKKNLLDFILTFHLGEMMACYPRGHYYIVSGDRKDFVPVVDHLRGNHFHVSLHPDIASLPFLVPPARVPTAKEKQVPVAPSVPAVTNKLKDRRVEIIARLKNPKNKNRPKTLKGLQAHIRTALGKESEQPAVQAVIDALYQDGLSIDSKGKVSYA